MIFYNRIVYIIANNLLSVSNWLISLVVAPKILENWFVVIKNTNATPNYLYYILLCDGMGTGEEAAREGKRAGVLLRDLLAAGYPAEYALRTVNSLCALQGKAGIVTIDLAELRLDTGKAVLYKWGAAPSYLIDRGEPIKIGTATPPPGLSVTEARETVERLSLRRGETLVLLSDGAGREGDLRLRWERAGEPVSELASRILESSQTDGSDDATVAVVRLVSSSVST